MVQSAIDPQTFFFQVLLNGTTSCHLATIYKTDILLPLMQVYLRFIFWLSFCHQVESRRSYQSGDKIWSNTELLKFLSIFFISLYHIGIVFVLLCLFCQLRTTIRALAMSICNDSPTFWCRIACGYIQQSVTLNNIRYIVVIFCILTFCSTKYVESFARIFCVVKIEHIAIIHSNRLIANAVIILHFFCNGNILTAMLTTTHFQ